MLDNVHKSHSKPRMNGTTLCINVSMAIFDIYSVAPSMLKKLEEVKNSFECHLQAVVNYASLSLGLKIYKFLNSITFSSVVFTEVSFSNFSMHCSTYRKSFFVDHEIRRMA